MHRKWLHSPCICQILWWLKPRIKLTNGTSSCTLPNDYTCGPLRQSQAHRMPSIYSISILHRPTCKTGQTWTKYRP
jgi:hypothetical protein